jgi:type IV pilus assembly protein PilC
MTNFKYFAKDASGGFVQGTVAARDQREVLGKLRDKSLTILEIRETVEGPTTAQKFFALRSPSKKVKKKELVIMTRQLSTMISAGIPLLEALEILVGQAESPALSKVLAQLVEDIRGGSDFSRSLEKHPKVFSTIFISMIRAGEASGQLDIILLRLAEYLEAAEKLRRDIRAAMTYPVISLIIIFGIAGFLMVGIIPKFKDIFDSLGIELPALTSFILGLSFAIRNNVLLILGGMVGFVFALGLFRKTEPGGRMFDWLMLKTPLLGPLFRKVALSRFSRTLATLIKSGVPILEALEIVSSTIGNRIIAEVVEEARENVRQGDTLSQPLAESPVFPPMVTKMIGIGEKSGAMETLLEKISQFYDEQVNAEVKSLTSVIEPLMIGIMGFMVGGIVLAVFLPIFKLQQELAKGNAN